jgi:hypothetical protein
VCVDRAAAGCSEPSSRVVVDPTIDTAADAWAQHLETAIAVRLGGAQGQEAARRNPA